MMEVFIIVPLSAAAGAFQQLTGMIHPIHFFRFLLREMGVFLCAVLYKERVRNTSSV